MLREQTLAKLRAMRLLGMAYGYADQIAMPDAQALPFDDRLGLLVDREDTDRQNRRYQSRLRTAKYAKKQCWKIVTSDRNEVSTNPKF